MHVFQAACGLLLATRALAGTVTATWDITWVNAAPDGFERPVIGVNGAWPCPTLEATVGDTVVLTIHNQLGNETTGLHFHGIDQVYTGWMDGPSGVTQCPVPPGSSITYTFLADKPGTFWCKPRPLPPPSEFRLPDPQTTPTTWASIPTASAAR